MLGSGRIALMETKKQTEMKTYIVRWVDVANLAMGSTPVVAKSVREVYKYFANTYGKTAKITSLEVTL